MLILAFQGQEYPPWRNVIDVDYDFPAKRAKTTVLEGFEVNSTFIRRFDTKWEYQIRGGEFPDCFREYLSASPCPNPIFSPIS